MSEDQVRVQLYGESMDIIGLDVEWWRKSFEFVGWVVEGLVGCGHTFIPPRHGKEEPEGSFEEISFPKPGVAL